MRTLFSYILIICLALSSLIGSVAYADSALSSVHTKQNIKSHTNSSQHQHSLTTESTLPCHTISLAIPQTTSSNENLDCCNQDQQSCEGTVCDKGCCASHCVVASALLNTSLFSYIPATTESNDFLLSLPTWLFFKDPPPPIIA